VTTVERATEMAEQGAAEHRAGQPPALVLPDGWAREYDSCRWSPDDEDHFYLDVDPTDGIEIGDVNYEPDAARALAARLVEAAGIVEQLRAGAS
jgi:hypothetical protein